MGAEQSELNGPDLTLGVPFSNIGDGKMVAGHAHGESVLLARRGENLFAIGASCTHYGGPLAEGILVDDTLRCPWHHACFSLHTGEALRGPALNPVSCWHVEKRDDTVYVTGKKFEDSAQKTQPEPLKAGAQKAQSEPLKARAQEKPISAIVIVGAGAAGDAAAATLRSEGYEGRITMISADSVPSYDRPNLSKDYLAGTAPEEWLPLRSETYYEEHGIDLLLDAQVVCINTQDQKVELANGDTHRYDRLLLATGAVPVRFPLPGSDLPHVHTLRTLADCRAITEQVGATRAVVIGAGFIGMEVAASLRTRGHEVHVVAPDSNPLERVFGPAMGAMVRALHEEHSVVFHLGQIVTSITSNNVTLSKGDVIEADLVVIGVGVHPATVLAETAGLNVEKGILVDKCLETSHTGIFAAGDVARWPDCVSNEHIRIEHWVVAQRQGQVAARNMLGNSQPFDAVPFFWTQHYDVPIAYVGHASSWDQIDVLGSIEDRDCIVAYRLEGKTLAVASIYRDQESLQAEHAFEQNDEQALERLIPKSKKSS